MLGLELVLVLLRVVGHRGAKLADLVDDLGAALPLLGERAQRLFVLRLLAIEIRGANLRFASGHGVRGDARVELVEALGALGARLLELAREAQGLALPEGDPADRGRGEQDHEHADARSRERATLPLAGELFFARLGALRLEQDLELVGDGAHAGPVLGLHAHPPREARVHVLADRGEKVREAVLADGCRRSLLVRVDDLPARHRLRARERFVSDEGEEERGGEAVRVHLLAERRVLVDVQDRRELLGRRVQRRAGDERRLDLGRDAEIEQDRVQAAPELGEEDVVGLHVLVTEPRVVERLERARDGEKDVVRLAEGQRPLAEALVERLALVDRHRQPDVLGGHAVVLQLDHVRVTDGREHDELTLDVAADVERPRKDLQRDPVLGYVDALGDVDLAEVALAQEPDEPVVQPDHVADGGELPLLFVAAAGPPRRPRLGLRGDRRRERTCPRGAEVFFRRHRTDRTGRSPGGPAKSGGARFCVALEWV